MRKVPAELMKLFSIGPEAWETTAEITTWPPLTTEEEPAEQLKIGG
jgi:hypothetical protein